MRVITIMLPDAESLRDNLDALNEMGKEPLLGGIDSEGHYFLAELRGPYAGTTLVTYRSPLDDPERDTPDTCDECRTDLHQPDENTLTYPVYLQMPVSEDPERVAIYDRMMRGQR